MGCLQHFERFRPPGYHCPLAPAPAPAPERWRQRWWAGAAAGAHRLAGRTREGADQEADGTLVKLRARLFAPRVARRNLLFDDELLDGLVVPLARRVQAGRLGELGVTPAPHEFVAHCARAPRHPQPGSPSPTRYHTLAAAHPRRRRPQRRALRLAADADDGSSHVTVTATDAAPSARMQTQRGARRPAARRSTRAARGPRHARSARHARARTWHAAGGGNLGCFLEFVASRLQRPRAAQPPGRQGSRRAGRRPPVARSARPLPRRRSPAAPAHLPPQPLPSA